jgi:hypothetical protein
VSLVLAGLIWGLSMGLDLFELVLGIEQSVGVPIPNDVATTLTTPRQLIAYLLGCLPQSRSNPCLSQRAFYVLRRALANCLPVAPRVLRPGTELATVLPQDGTRSAWEQVGRAAGLPQWPRGPGRRWLAALFCGRGPTTLGEVASHLAGSAAFALKPAGEGFSWREVEGVVAWQFAHHLGIRGYALDDRFVEGMGLA